MSRQPSISFLTPSLRGWPHSRESHERCGPPHVAHRGDERAITRGARVTRAHPADRSRRRTTRRSTLDDAVLEVLRELREHRVPRQRRDLAPGWGDRRSEIRLLDVRTHAPVLMPALITHALWFASPEIYAGLTGPDRERNEESVIDFIKSAESGATGEQT